MHPIDGTRDLAPARPTAGSGAGNVAQTLRAEFAEIFATLRRKWIWIAAWTAAALLLAVIGLLLSEPRYTSTAQLMLDPRGLQVVDREVTARHEDSQGNAAIIETQMQVLTSDSVLRRVVEQERLDLDPEFNGTPRGPVARWKAAIKSMISEPKEGGDPFIVAVRTLREHVVVDRVPGSYVVYLSVSSESPDKAAALVAALAETFMEVQSSASQSAAGRASEALASRLEELRERVNDAENEVEAYKAANQIVGANGSLVNEQQLSELSQQLVEARARTSELKARYDQIQRLQGAGNYLDATSDIVQSPAIAQLRARYAELKRLQDDLNSKLGPNHPTLAAVREQVEGFRQSIAEETARIVASVRNSYEQARENEEALSRSLEGMTAQSHLVNRHMVRLRELEREAEAHRTVYEDFLTRTQETREQQQLDTGNTRIISLPHPPLEANGLPSIVILLVAGAMGMSFGAGTAVARERLDGRVHSARQLAVVTGLSVLAEMQPLRRSTRGAASGFPFQHTAKLSALREFGRLYDVLTGRGASQRQTVLVMSPDDHAGAVRAAFDLALCASARGDRVLLVDADPAGALTVALKGERDLAPAGSLQHHSPVQPMPSEMPQLGIHFLSAARRTGGGVPEAAMVRQVMAAGEGYDLVVVAGGLVSGDRWHRAVADAATHGVLVVRAEKSTFDAIESARVACGSFAASVMGAVFVRGEPDLDLRIETSSGTVTPLSRPAKHAAEPAAL